MFSNKTITLVKIAKISSYLFGAIMFIFTYKSFGIPVASFLAVGFTYAFWRLTRKEEYRLIGEEIAMEIKAAIRKIDDLDSVVEIRQLKKGLIARVYLIDAKERIVLFQKAITKQLENCIYKNHIWAMQLTDMSRKEDFNDSRRFLDEELYVEIKKRYDSKNNKNDKK